MKYKAHDYQQYAADFILEHPVSCLILDMGLEKNCNRAYRWIRSSGKSAYAAV